LLDPQILNDLSASARHAMDRAHVPVSSFPVGAAVLTAKGNIYPGCNTESIIAGLGVCAERSAIDHAVVHGERHFKAILIISNHHFPLLPCGACRQYLHEFAQIYDEDLMVYAVSPEGDHVCYSLSQLLPHSFGPKDKRP